MKINKNLSKMSIFMVGIGGISMSGLAKILLRYGCKVSGSDISTNCNIYDLEKMGVKIYKTHKVSNISNDIDLVVYSGAINKNNCEILSAKNKKIKVIERSKLLGIICSKYNNVIAVSGTHGKTTTASIIGKILIDAKLNPTIHIGGNLIDFNTNTIVGSNDYLVIESCEYRNSFKYIKSKIGIILNIEKEHLDYYNNLNSIYKSFKYFAKNSKTLFVDSKLNFKHKNKIDVFKFWKVKNINITQFGYSFDVYKNCKFYNSFNINLYGIHNIYNALYAIAVCDLLKINKNIISNSLSNFSGVKRRYETISNKIKPIIIDYAHHPTEIKCSIIGLLERYKKIMFIFQPHTFSRTKYFFDDFLKVFNSLDNILIYKTFSARENLSSGVSSFELYKNIKNVNKYYFDNFDLLVKHINKYILNYDAVLILGAGNLAEDIKQYFIS